MKKIIAAILAVALLPGCSAATRSLGASGARTADMSSMAAACVSGAIIEMDEYYRLAEAARRETEMEPAMFSTKYNVNNMNRAYNIVLAAATINGLTVYPGDVFSYNNAVGDTSEKAGYKVAKIFIKGQDAQAYGGGVCQVSSTLFNAAEFGGMEIIERHSHSKKVYYVEDGRDAATSYGGVDLKFKNTRDYPVVILAAADNGTLTVRLAPA